VRLGDGRGEKWVPRKSRRRWQATFASPAAGRARVWPSVLHDGARCLTSRRCP
jgi:hypothetical protein